MLTRVDVYIADRVEYIANNSKDLELTKSEVVRIILTDTGNYLGY